MELWTDEQGGNWRQAPPGPPEGEQMDRWLGCERCRRHGREYAEWDECPECRRERLAAGRAASAARRRRADGVTPESYRRTPAPPMRRTLGEGVNGLLTWATVAVFCALAVGLTCAMVVGAWNMIQWALGR